MGVDINTWRGRIGRFTQRFKIKSKLHGLKVPGYVYSISLRVTMCLALILILGGDVELNPGPPKSQTSRSVTRNKGNNNLMDNSGINTQLPINEGVSTRQRTLSSYSFSQHSPATQPRNPPSTYDNNDDLFRLMHEMKSDMNKQHCYVSDRLENVTCKIDNMATVVNELKSENIALKQETMYLKTEVEMLRGKIDVLESHSRRNNLRFHGIEGSFNESWDVTENKIRQFMKSKLNMTGADNIEIERAHRIKSNNPDKCAIIVKFAKYKDCVEILKQSKQYVSANSDYSVKQDYTDRVKRHRRLLGEIMLTKRNDGHYSVIQYDKLVIDDQIYRYDDTQGLVCLGRRHRPRTQTHGRRTHKNSVNSSSQRTVHEVPRDNLHNDDVHTDTDWITQEGMMSGQPIRNDHTLDRSTEPSTDVE